MCKLCTFYNPFDFEVWVIAMVALEYRHRNVAGGLGFMVGPEHEREGAVRKVCRMFTVGGSISVPMVTVVTRKAYGLGAQAMAIHLHHVRSGS